MSATSERTRAPQQRAERAVRILDTAADLLLRHGYRRVTIDDVAAGAGIGKGTVYLHWKTREELFTAVLAREVLAAIDELLAALRTDPEVSRLHRFAQVYFLAVMNRPLLRGFVLADAELWGKLARPRDSGRDDRHRLAARGYLELLDGRGLLREDLDAGAVGYAFQAVLEGFLQAEASAGPADGGVEDRAELLARTVQWAFESGHRLSTAELDALAVAVADLFTALTEADRAALGLTEG